MAPDWGAVYAEMFPDRVRAMVLDGALDPALGTTERRLTQYAGFQRAFDLMAASCAQSPACVSVLTPPNRRHGSTPSCVR
ncbi:alpha/beta fold hydrolase [Rhodococcus hoagii]|nr:alpha/beta fold hydrolase [Prescottella equi]